MLEYASNRLRLFCQIATRLPRVIVSTETAERIVAHSNPRNDAHTPGPRLPMARSRNETLKNLIIIANPAALEATERNAVIVMGAPSYTSGVQKWKGAAEILYPNPARMRIPAMISATTFTSPPASAWFTP